MIENRVRTTMRASRIAWCMGVLAALGAVGSVVQAAANGNIVRTALPRVITVRDSGGLDVSQVPMSLGERLLMAAPDIVISSGLAAAAFLLAAVLAAVAAGRSFGEVSQRNLLSISLILVISSIVAIAITYLANWRTDVAVARLEETGNVAAGAYVVIAGSTATFSWLPLALGVIAAAFRWVIRDGATLEQEAEGVI